MPGSGTTMSDDDATDFARKLAPHIDALFMAGHASARSQARQVRENFGLASFGLLIDLRVPLLHSSGVSLQQVLAIERYVPPEEVRVTLDGHVHDGLLQRRGDGYVPTQQGREVLNSITDMLATSIAVLWREQQEVVALARPVLERVGHAATLLPVDQYPAFHAMFPGSSPSRESDAYRVWSLCAALRYLRADAHAAAWQTAGLSGPEVQVLSALWRGDEVPGGMDYPARLVQLGLLEREGRTPAITAVGRAVRDAIERATDERNALAFAPQAPHERMELLLLLRSLPPGVISGEPGRT